MYPAHFTVEFYGKFSWEKATVPVNCGLSSWTVRVDFGKKVGT
jgi:hypothetical protein